MALAKTIRDGLDQQSTIGQKRRLQRKAKRSGGRADSNGPRDRDVDDVEEEEIRSGDDEELSADEGMDEAKDNNDDDADGDNSRSKIDKRDHSRQRRSTDEGEKEALNSKQEEENDEHDDDKDDVDNKYHGCKRHVDRVVG